MTLHEKEVVSSHSDEAMFTLQEQNTQLEGLEKTFQHNFVWTRRDDLLKTDREISFDSNWL